MGLKKVLLYTGKFPLYGQDTDGGSVLVNSLINILKDKSILDIVFIRTYNEIFKNIDGVNKVYFETYNYRDNNKFNRRIINKDQVFSRLESLIDNYDKVIITHVSKAFGIDKFSLDNRNKIIIFPMYLSPSYERGNEFPPLIYKEEEKKALISCAKILTPSVSEKLDMINVYGCDKDKIVVIPRGISNLIKPTIKKIKDRVDILYIGSIKEQKNTLESIEIINLLRLKGYNVYLHLVGSIQSIDVYNKCINFINDKDLGDYVIFYGVLSMNLLADLITKCHFNVSTSYWETFGRGIFEGMFGGLPTIIYSNLSCVKEYINDGDGIYFLDNKEQFVDKIIELINDEKLYESASNMVVLSTKHLSIDNENKRLLEELL